MSAKIGRIKLQENLIIRLSGIADVISGFISLNPEPNFHYNYIVVTVHTKIYRICVLDLFLPRRAFVSSSVARSDIQQRYLCHL